MIISAMQRVVTNKFGCPILGPALRRLLLHIDDGTAWTLPVHRWRWFPIISSIIRYHEHHQIASQSHRPSYVWNWFGLNWSKKVWIVVIKCYYFFLTRGNDTRNKHESTSACFKWRYQRNYTWNKHSWWHNALWNSVIIVVMPSFIATHYFFSIVSDDIPLPPRAVFLCVCLHYFADTNCVNTVLVIVQYRAQCRLLFADTNASFCVSLDISLPTRTMYLLLLE